MDQPWKPTLPEWPPEGDEQVVSEHRIFSLVETRRRSPRTGRSHRFLRLEAPDWVNVIALTRDGRVVLVEQYRHGTDEVTLEIPGGAVDPGETSASAAARELEEETGYRPARLEPIGCVEPNPAFLTNRCWTYLALGCEPIGRLNPDPSEEIEVHLVGLGGFTELIAGGTIRHALVVAAHEHLRLGLERGASWSAGLDAAR